MRATGIRPGDILEFKGNLIRVLTLDLKGRGTGFYYYPCDSIGNLKHSLMHSPDVSPANFVQHSNMLIGETFKILKNIPPIETITANIKGHTYTINLIGHGGIDTYMANLDDRYSALMECGSKAQIKTYLKNEDINYHYRNAQNLTRWFKKYSINKAWSEFARDTIRYECPELESKLNPDDFGTLMTKIIAKYGTAESVLWSSQLPMGTEDRTWVRTWLYLQGCKEYRDIPKSLDHSHVARILKQFKGVL